MISRSSRNSTHPSSKINVMSVAEACAKFDGFFKTPSLMINPLPFGSDVSNKLFDDPKTQSMIDIQSLSSDIRHQLFQVPVMLCEIEKLQNCLGINNNEIAANTSLAQKRDMRDKLSTQLCVSLITLMESKEIRNISHPKSKKNLDELLYEIALTLANLNPVNDIDFATQEPIAPENRIVTSDRYQHDINSLQQWLRHRNTNPWTNLQFSRRDIDFVKLSLITRKPNDEIEISEGNDYQGGDPNLEATLHLARTLQQSTPNHVRLERNLDSINLEEFFWENDGPHPVEQPHGAGSHHEVMPIRNRPISLGFFRRQPYEEPNPQLMSEFEAVAWRAYRALVHTNPSRHQATTTPRANVGITVADILNFPEINEQTMRYWPTQQRQTDSEQEQQTSSLPKP